MRPDELYVKSLQGQIATGNQQAFAGLFRLFYSKLHSFSMQYVHIKEVAEEITNDVFIKLWNRRDEISEQQWAGPQVSAYLLILNPQNGLRRDLVS